MDFTNEEKERITQLYGNDFADITPDDAMLIGRWEAWKATTEAAYQAQMQSIKEQTDAVVIETRSLSEQARNNLQTLQNAALARLERFDDGA